eukprot:5522504-Pleurochrysis_carterae.AAC.2
MTCFASRVGATGQRALPGALHCFDQLVSSKKAVLVLSNASRRRSAAVSKLARLGFDVSALSGFVTSGEEAWQHMASEMRGKKAVWFTWEQGYNNFNDDYTSGLDLKFTNAEEADFVLCQRLSRIDLFERESSVARFTCSYSEHVLKGRHAPPGCVCHACFRLPSFSSGDCSSSPGFSPQLDARRRALSWFYKTTAPLRSSSCAAVVSVQLQRRFSENASHAICR